jgi:hypothetical protein
MNLGRLERAIILAVIGVFILSCLNLSSVFSNSITKEEAIEISENSDLVKEGLAIAYSFSADATYYNSSAVEQLKQGHNREIYENVPEGHGAWELVWGINRGLGGYLIIIIVDAGSRTMIHETKGIELEKGRNSSSALMLL